MARLLRRRSVCRRSLFGGGCLERRVAALATGSWSGWRGGPIGHCVPRPHTELVPSVVESAANRVGILGSSGHDGRRDTIRALRAADMVSFCPGGCCLYGSPSHLFLQLYSCAAI